MEYELEYKNRLGNVLEQIKEGKVKTLEDLEKINERENYSADELDYLAQKLYENGYIDKFGGWYPSTPEKIFDDEILLRKTYGIGINNYVAIDAETYDLRGTAQDPYDLKNTFAIAITGSDGKSRTFMFIEEEKASEWTKENVIKNLDKNSEDIIICNSYEDMMIQAANYLDENYYNLPIITHMPSPVEYNVLRQMDIVTGGNHSQQEVIDVSKMKYMLNGQEKVVGDSVNRVINELNLKKWGNDHDPLADAKDAETVFKEIKKQYVKELDKKFEPLKKEFLEPLRKEDGSLDVVKAINDLNKIEKVINDKNNSDNYPERFTEADKSFYENSNAQKIENMNLYQFKNSVVTDIMNEYIKNPQKYQIEQIVSYVEKEGTFSTKNAEYYDQTYIVFRENDGSKAYLTVLPTVMNDYSREETVDKFLLTALENNVPVNYTSDISRSQSGKETLNEYLEEYKSYSDEDNKLVNKLHEIYLRDSLGLEIKDEDLLKINEALRYSSLNIQWQGEQSELSEKTLEQIKSLEESNKDVDLTPLKDTVGAYTEEELLAKDEAQTK